MKVTRIFPIKTVFYHQEIKDLVESFSLWFKDVEVELYGVWQDKDGELIFIDGRIRCKYDNKLDRALIDGAWEQPFPMLKQNRTDSKIKITGFPIID